MRSRSVPRLLIMLGTATFSTPWVSDTVRAPSITPHVGHQCEALCSCSMAVAPSMSSHQCSPQREQQSCALRSPPCTGTEHADYTAVVSVGVKVFCGLARASHRLNVV